VGRRSKLADKAAPKKRLVISYGRFAVLLITLGLIQVRCADRRGRLSKIAHYLRREGFDVSAKMNFGLSKKLASLI